MITVNFDGGCGPANPGGAMTYAAVIDAPKEGQVKLRGRIAASPNNSNNVAEYLGLMLALNWLVEHAYSKDKIAITGDSQLVISQMSGRWKIKKGLYKEQALATQTLCKQFRSLTWHWVPRDYNSIADEYARG